MIRLRPVLITALAAAAYATGAAAQQDGMYSSPYFRLDTGYSWGQDSVNNSMIYGGGIGGNINPWLRSDVTVDYRGWYKADENSRFVGAGTADVKSLSEMLNLYWDIGHYNLTGGPFGQLTPYIGGGVGAAENRTDSYGTATGGGVGSRTHTDFAWQAGAGTSISLAQNLALDVGYRYVDLGRAESSNQGNTAVGTPISGVKSSTDLKANEIHGGLRFNF